MSLFDMINNEKHEIYDIFGIKARKNKIEELSNKIIEKINILESIGIETKSLREKLKETKDKYNHLDENTNDVLNLLSKYKREITQIVSALNDYDKYIDLLMLFKHYELNLHKTEEYRNDIIQSLEKLKETEEFTNENFAKYIHNIYEICYKFMKYEFIYNGYSILFDYFKTNPHDYYYMGLFIKNNIEKLTSSINYIEGLQELEDMINNKNDTNNLMDKEIIINLSKCELREEYIKASELKLKEYCKRFNDIYSKLYINVGVFGAILPKNYFADLNIRKLKKEYLHLLKEYHEFMKDKEFLKETNEKEILSISNMKLKISPSISLKEELLNDVYRIKRKLTLQK